MPTLDAAHRWLGPAPWEDEIPALAGWAEEHTTQLDSLRPRLTEAAEVSALNAGRCDVDRAASDLAPLVETMLIAAMARFDAEVGAARAEAAAAVAGVMRRVADGRALDRPAVATGCPEPDLNERCATEASEHVFGPESEELREPAQVFEMFWADATHDRAVIGRLRRWVQREDW